MNAAEAVSNCEALEGERGEMGLGLSRFRDTAGLIFIFILFLFLHSLILIFIFLSYFFYFFSVTLFSLSIFLQNL